LFKYCSKSLKKILQNTDINWRCARFGCAAESARVCLVL